jgi:hypothetical protein
MTSVAWYGSAMCFDSYKTPGQGPTSYGWQTAVRSDGFGTITARQFVGNLVDEVGNGNWPISDIQNDSVNEGSSIYGYVPISQDNGAWLWSPVPLPAGVTISGGSTYFEGHFYGQLQDSYGSLGTAGYVATSTDTSGDWQWTPPIDVVPDSGSAGGTCIHVKASDNGQDMYIHVDSSGTITATTTP